MSGNGDSDDKPRRVPTTYEEPKQGISWTFTEKGIEVDATEAHASIKTGLMAWPKVMEMARRFGRPEDYDYPGDQDPAGD